MNIFREIPPTAGYPVKFRDIFSAFSPIAADKDPLEDAFKRYTAAGHARVTSSGTAALFLILEALKNRSKRRTVVITAFTCPLVPLAIKRAGLKVEACDTEKTGFGFCTDELERLCEENKDVLAVVAAHIGGVPIEMERVTSIAKRHGIFVIEDCAQALGALYDGRHVGTIGDFSFFSFACGKGATMYEGGMAVANRKEYAPLLDGTITRCVKDTPVLESLRILQLLGYWIFYRPALFWFAFRLPQIFWTTFGDVLRANGENFNDDFPVHKVSLFRKRVCARFFQDIDGEIANQRSCAEFYIDKLKGIKGLNVIKEADSSKATYLFLCVVFDNPGKRLAALKALENSGLGASISYLYPVNGYKYLKDVVPDRLYSYADSLSRRVLTLSTSAFLSGSEKKLAADKIMRILTSHANSPTMILKKD